ncbi:MAG: MaoC/PaaZ C-terminal domain-containing protein [Haliea sp.]|uniref:MaoC/PaaZ C-terminal domain-containing protein n=1 Tax=Haliea sp. TaxID=1932666 RepID=UPI0032EFE51B
MTRYWQDIQPGEQFETGQLSISKQDILEFAAEFDPQPYHLDSDAAADSIFGGLCASGWQVAALMMRLLTDSLHRQALPIAGISAVPVMRWKMPVFADDTLSARVTVTGREETSRLSGSGSLDLDVVVFNQHSKAVIELSARLLVAIEETAHAG